MTPSRRSCPLCKGDTWNRQCPRCGGKGNVAAPAPDAPAARPPVVTLSWGEYESLRRALDEATARAVRCEGVEASLREALDRVAPEWGRFSPADDTCVFCGMAYAGKDPITCDHDDDCPWVLARAAIAAERDR